MRRLLLIFSCLGALVLTGCVNPVLVKVGYERPVSNFSDKTGSIRLSTGIVEGARGSTLMYAGPGIFVPVSTGPYPHLQFNFQDQRIFVESLKGELTRLKLLRSAEISEQRHEPADITIDLVFAQTTHNPDMHDYFLNVALQLASGEKTFAKRYEISSSEGESIWIKMGTNAAEGKEKAAKKLLDKIIPDVEKFIGDLK